MLNAPRKRLEWMGVGSTAIHIHIYTNKYWMTQDIRQYISIIETYFSNGVPEEFITTMINNNQVNVHWDKLKSAKNKANKGYTLDQAIPVLNDPDALVYEDDIYNEARFRTIGKTDGQDIVSVAWSSVDTGEEIMCFRIIGIREAKPGEKALYRKTQMTTDNKKPPVAEQLDLDDVPEIPTGAKLVSMKHVMDKLVARFNQRRAQSVKQSGVDTE